MDWMLLVLAGLLEVGWIWGLKASDGLTRWAPAALTVLAAVLSLVLLGQAARTIPLGTAYAVWVGIGTLGSAVVGLVFFGDPASWLRIASLLLVVLGLVGLKLSS